jgi:hypothetical protein
MRAKAAPLQALGQSHIASTRQTSLERERFAPLSFPIGKSALFRYKLMYCFKLFLRLIEWTV